MNLPVTLLVGSMAGAVAAVMCYLITYNEYEHHFKGRRVVIESIKSALVAFVFFFLLVLLLSFLIGKTTGG